MNLNRVLLIGNLTRDPDLRFTAGGQAVCKLGLAMNRRYTTASGEAKEEACFVDVTVWGKQGEHTAQYMRKGSQVMVEGRLQLDTWQDRETGQTRSRLSVCAERVQFGDRPRQDGERPQGQAPGRAQGQAQGQTPPQASAADEAMGDIPF